MVIMNAIIVSTCAWGRG